MKVYILIIALLVLCTAGISQPKIRVLIADGNIQYKDGSKVRTLDFIEGKEKISMTNGSYLVFVDKTGKYFEYSDSSMITINDLNLPKLNKKNYQDNVLDDMSLLNKNEYEPWFYDGKLPVNIYKPHYASNGIFSKILCVKWIDNNHSDNYTVLGRNLKGDTLFMSATNNCDFILDKNFNEVIIITIHDVYGKDLSMEYIWISFESEGYCKNTNIVENVLIGLYLEKIKQFDLAHKYFKRAVMDSQSPSVSQIYDMHLQRFKKYKE